MKCAAPFFAGDPFRPETFLVTSGCGNAATSLAIRQHVTPELRAHDVGEAGVCGVHIRSLQQFAEQYAKRGERGERLWPLRFEAIPRFPGAYGKPVAPERSAA